MQTWSWLRDRSTTHAISLAPYELYTEHAPRVIARLGATTLGDLCRTSEEEVLAACTAVGAGLPETREILGMLAEYLAQEGLAFRREPPVVVVERRERPTRPALSPGLLEHVGGTYRTYRLDAPPRPEHYPSADGASWELRGCLVSLGVAPLETADVETLAPTQYVGTMEAGPWGAFVECERIPRYAAHAGPGYDATLFDAQLGLRCTVSLQAWGTAKASTLPDDLIAVTSAMARSLAPR